MPLRAIATLVRYDADSAQGHPTLLGAQGFGSGFPPELTLLQPRWLNALKPSPRRGSTFLDGHRRCIRTTHSPMSLRWGARIAGPAACYGSFTRIVRPGSVLRPMCYMAPSFG